MVEDEGPKPPPDARQGVAGRPRRVRVQPLLTNEIGTLGPQLEPQITSLETCKIN